MPLCLTLKECSFLFIGEHIKITFAKARGNRIKVWVEAPRDLKVWSE